ncbi:uncharacterized protein [Primulina eburnea]|uniref:uncharacterized protein isoform X3 n=1 Tax=Primulina eburnea TaxID=1245227 RepID=UPI003C6C7B17
MKFLDFGIPGGPDFLLLKEAPKPTCRDCEIVIQVAAAGLNLYDSLDRQRISYPYTRISKLGFECSGRVVAVGFYASKKFKVGDEVCAILQGGGGCAEFIAIPHSHALRIPPGVTLAQAAALPLASCLTLYAFSMWTTIASGKTILIHWDAGGIDTIAIQYAKHVLRCDVIAVAALHPLPRPPLSFSKFLKLLTTVSTACSPPRPPRLPVRRLDPPTRRLDPPRPASTPLEPPRPASTPASCIGGAVEGRLPPRHRLDGRLDRHLEHWNPPFWPLF